MLFSWIGESPGVALAYLALTLLAGVLLMRLARIGFFELLRRWGERAQAGEAAASPWALFLFGKMWIVGALLFFPGYITDAMALALVCFSFFAAPKNDGGGNDGGTSDDGMLRARAVVIEESAVPPQER